MAFTIDIGYTTDNNLKVGKAVTWLTPIGGVTISPLSVIKQLSPVFIIDRNDSYLSANYVNCTYLGRKYFAKVAVDTAQTMIITCESDPLSSFDLSGCPIQVTRNGGIGKPTDYPDTKYPILPNQKDITSIIRSNPILTANGGAYILTVIGGNT